MTIFEAQRRMQQVVDGLDAEIDVILNDLEPEIVKMQQERLWSGLLSDGNEIEPEYTFVTTDLKLRKGQPVDRVTLKDTGDFYNDIFAARFKDDVIIDSNDNKSEELKEKYTEKIFGLTDDNSTELKSKSTEMLLKYVKRITKFA